jgi:hypothetical protein
MLAKYFWNLVLLAWVSSWRAADVSPKLSSLVF